MLKLPRSRNLLAWPQITMILIVILAPVEVSEWVLARMRAARHLTDRYLTGGI